LQFLLHFEWNHSVRGGKISEKSAESPSVFFTKMLGWGAQKYDCPQYKDKCPRDCSSPKNMQEIDAFYSGLTGQQRKKPKKTVDFCKFPAL